MNINITLLVQTLTKSYNTPNMVYQSPELISYDTDIGVVCVDIDGDTVTLIYTLDPDGEPFEQLYPQIF